MTALSSSGLYCIYRPDLDISYTLITRQHVFLTRGTITTTLAY